MQKQPQLLAGFSAEIFEQRQVVVSGLDEASSGQVFAAVRHRALHAGRVSERGRELTPQHSGLPDVYGGDVAVAPEEFQAKKAIRKSRRRLRRTTQYSRVLRASRG